MTSLRVADSIIDFKSRQIAWDDGVVQSFEQLNYKGAKLGPDSPPEELATAVTGVRVGHDVEYLRQRGLLAHGIDANGAIRISNVAINTWNGTRTTAIDHNGDRSVLVTTADGGRCARLIPRDATEVQNAVAGPVLDLQSFGINSAELRATGARELASWMTADVECEGQLADLMAPGDSLVARAQNAAVRQFAATGEASIGVGAIGDLADAELKRLYDAVKDDADPRFKANVGKPGGRDISLQGVIRHMISSPAYDGKTIALALADARPDPDLAAVRKSIHDVCVLWLSDIDSWKRSAACDALQISGPQEPWVRAQLSLLEMREHLRIRHGGETIPRRDVVRAIASACDPDIQSGLLDDTTRRLGANPVLARLFPKLRS